MNQNPEQIARDKIDQMLAEAGWLVQSKSTINLFAGIGVALREVKTESGSADYILFVNSKPVGVIEAKAEELDTGRTNQHVIIIRSKNKSFVPKYLKYFLQSPDIHHWISNANYRVTRQALIKNMLESLELPLPKTQKQHQIVQEIESSLSVCDKINQSITESLEKAQALRQSILKKVFAGTLLSEAEIATCKSAPDYEPASVLLAKIKAEKI